MKVPKLAASVVNLAILISCCISCSSSPKPLLGGVCPAATGEGQSRPSAFPTLWLEAKP